MSNYWEKKLDELNKSNGKSSSGSSSSNYWERKQTELEEANRKKKKKKDDDIAPVVTTKKENDTRSWFQKGAFEDGYQFGDVFRTVRGTGQDISENLLTGALGIVEKTVDAGAYVAGGVGGLFGADKFKDSTAEFIKKDIINEEKAGKIASKIIGGNWIADAVADAIAPMPENTDDVSVLGEKSDALVQSGGQLAATIGLQSVGVPWFVTSGVTAFGGEAESALNQGASYGEAGVSGLISAGAEILTEKISGGIKFGGKALDDGLTRLLAQKISNKFLRNGLKLGLDFVGEGAEEWITEDISRFGQWLTYRDDEELKELLFSEEAMDEKIESFLAGGLLGGGMGGVNIVSSRASGRDYTSGMTANEEAVFNKEYENRIAEEEKGGKKLTTKEKNKIYDQVLKDMEEGGISTDTIEEVLGGDAYKSYRDAVYGEDAKIKELEDQIKELEDAPNTVGNSKKYDSLTSQLEELKNASKRNDLKSQLSDTVFGMVQNDRLAESYYEVERKGQDFVADFSKYEKAKHKDAARKTLENAIKAGANNTRPVRNFVEMVARTSGDTGLSYDFKSGNQIKADFIERQTKLIAEMEKIPEAQRTEAQAKKLASMKDLLAKVENGDTIVNGDITENGIVLNLDSAKPLNRVVGHEIMHSLEQAKYNGKLRDALFAFAKTKGIDIDGKIAEYAAIYEGVENANPEAELVSDLVGDFLFSDADFINHLSANHRNVFQYVYDKIKYLCKVATAGSKELRQLEKVKKAFEDAYRSGGKAQSGTNYAISSVGGRHMPVIDIKNDTRDIGAAEAYLETLVDTENVFSTILYDAHPVYIGNDLPSEYKGSEYTFGMNSSLRKVKMQAATNLDEMLLLASNGEWVKNKKDKHNKDAKNGWYRYDTEFAVPVMRYKDLDHYTVYGATLLIRNDADGKSYLYDMVDVKEKQKVFNSPTSVEAVFESRPSADDNVAQPDEKVKHDYSLTDTTYMDAVNRGDTETAQQMVLDVGKGAGYTVRAYHGTRRGDRVGNVFLPERATSGPMAFFTDSKEIAEHYARDKADTSLAYDEEYEDYYSQFRVNQNGKSVKVQDLWRSLPFAEKQRVKEAGKHITWDEDMVNIVWDDDATNGLGNWDAYTLNLHKGNAIEALIDSWLESGELYGNEGDFIQVLEMAGIKGVEYRDPDARHDKVYDTLLKIQKPFDTATVDDSFADGLGAWYSHQPDGKYDRDTANADMWDKNSQTAETFLDRLREDIVDGTTRAWTSIPDSVTDYLKSLGYDGIKDTGGKNGGAEHTVWIPFTPEQIKSADPVTYDDNGNVIPLSERFNPQEKDIRHSLSNNNLFAPIGKADFFGKDFGVSARDLKLEAPVAVSEMETTTPVQETGEVAPDVVNDMFPDDLAPIADDPTRFDSLTDEDAPPERVVEQEDRGYQIPLPKTVVSWIAKTAREDLGLSNNQMADLHRLIEDYSMQEFPSREQLFNDIKDKFGIIVEADEDSEIKDVKRHLRGQRIFVSDTIKGDIPDYNEWRRAFFGGLRFSRQGLPVDVAYQELSGIYPSFFPADLVNPTDQLLQMAAVSKYEATMEREWDIDDDTLWGVTDDIIEAVTDYQRNQSEATREREYRQAVDSYARGGDEFAPPVAEEHTAPTATAQAVTENNAVPAEQKAESDKPIKTVKERLAEKLANTETELANNQRLREQAKADYAQEIARLEAEYNAKANKNTIAANDLLRRIERTKRLMGNVDADYAKRIADLEAKVAKMNTPEYKTASRRMVKQQEYSDWAKNLIGDTTSWVDKKLGLSYKINTLRRNLRYVVRDANGNADVKKADAIYDELEGRYDHNEARLKTESREIKQQYADMKITRAEDAYIQMLGELRHNPDTELTEEDVKEFYQKHKGKIDTEKVDKVIAAARKTYDDLLVRVNEVLREQGMKEIPYRKGYFPHFTNPKQGWLAKLLNWKTIDAEIPTDIAGLTEAFEPTRSWQSFNKQRKGDDTDYSFTQGLDTYVHGALDWIYHIEDIQRRRAFENEIRYVHSEKGVQDKIDAIRKNEEYDADEMQDQIDLVLAEARNPLNNFVTDLHAGTNTLASKKSSMDRALEEKTNRKVYSVLTNLNNRVNANMVVGSLSSALTNFIPITQSWLEVSPVYTVKGLGDFVRSTVHDDGVVAKSDFLTNRLVEEEKLYKTTWDKVSDKAAFMMNVIDSITSQTVWRSKYLQNISEGMSEVEAIKNADDFAKGLMAGRSRGNMPTIFDAKNPIDKVFTAFQLEVANQYGYMFDDAPKNAKSTARLIKGYAAMFIGSYVYNALYSSLVGRDAAFDPISIFEDLFRDMGLFGDDDDDDEKEPKDVVLGLTENILQEVPFVGGLLGGGRVPLSSAIPYTGNYGGLDALMSDIDSGLNDGNWTSLTKEVLKPLYYLGLPVGGGQIKKTVEGLSMFSDDHPVTGSYTDSGNLRFPVEDNLANRVQAGLFGQWASENAREYFDNDIAPLKQKQIQEYIDVDMPIRDYWDYRKGLNKQDTLEDKFDYIAGLDLPVAKKNILINNVVDRKDDVDMTNYDDFSTFEEFDFYTKNKEKYEFLQENGISYEEYTRTVVRKERYDSIYSWYKNNPEGVTLSKAVTDNVVEYRGYTSKLNDIKADKDSNGKSISGSRKEKVVNYVNGLDLDYGQRLILFKSEYKADDTYNHEIIEYLNSREDISYEDTVTILKELGFEVDSKGNIYWD